MNLQDLDVVLAYRLSRVFVWNDLEDMNLTRFNGSYLKIHSLESNRLVLESLGAVNSTCRFRTDEESFIDRTAFFLNFTHSWCYSPTSIGTYQFSIYDNLFYQEESERFTLEVVMAELEIVDPSSDNKICNRDKVTLRIKDPSITMR